MNPVLIYTDTEKIADEQSTLVNVVTLFQAIYNAIKAVGVTPTLAEINGLVYKAKTQNTTNFVKDYITNKLVAKVSPYVVNGVTFTDQALRGMIQIPDTANILAALQPVWGANSKNIFEGVATQVRINLLNLSNDVISSVAGADATLAGLYTFYTTTAAAATLATGLQAICDALNNFDDSNNKFFLKKMPPDEDRKYGQGVGGTSILGLDIIDDKFVVSLNFIREFEKVGTLGFVRNARNY